MPQAPSRRLIELVQDAERQLQQAGVHFGHGTTNAFDEAAWLVLWQLKLPLDTDLRASQGADHPVSLADQASVQALIAQRIQTRKPAAYLTHEAWLQGVPFYVDERSIVPRSLIAELIADATLDAFLGEHTRRVLDLCTGNGSLAILAAMAWPDVTVDAADISADALQVATINCQRHGLDGRIRVLQTDGLGSITDRYDLILCNPPYVNAQSMAALPAEYRQEPELALAGGADGMDFIRTLLPAVPAHMSDGAVLVLEIGNERANFEAAFPRLPVIWLETSAGPDQVLLIEKAALQA